MYGRSRCRTLSSGKGNALENSTKRLSLSVYRGLLFHGDLPLCASRRCTLTELNRLLGLR
jgi:hypothetical protein